MKETSKKLHKLWLIAAMALLITVFLEPANVKAAQPPTDLKQTRRIYKISRTGMDCPERRIRIYYPICCYTKCNDI